MRSTERQRTPKDTDRRLRSSGGRAQIITIMYVLGCEITIGTKRFNRVNEVTIERSAHSLEDVCEIKLPATARLVRGTEVIGEEEVAKTFAAGDEVIVKLGYDGVLREEFRGYVTSIKPEVPVVVKCIDGMYHLQRKNCLQSWKSVKLDEVLEYLVEGTPISLIGEVPTITFTKFYLRNVTAAYALQQLKEKYGLVIYLKGNGLYVSLARHDDGTEVRYEFGVNVIESKLEWVTEDDKRLKVEAVHIRKDNTRLKVEVGDKDGEKRTLYYYDVESEAALRKLAENDMKKLRYSGYKGDMTTFLLPNVEPGNVGVIQDNDWPERDGKYIVEKVTTTYGSQGARRKINLGLKV